MRKLTNKEIKEKQLMTVNSSHDELCRKTKELKEVIVKNLEDIKKVASLLESKEWIAIYATSNKDNVIVVLAKI